MSRNQKILIPLAPLTDYIARQGGLAEAIGSHEYEVEIDKAPYYRTVSSRDVDQQRRYTMVRTALRDARRDNPEQIDLFAADRICCDALGIHPSEVYGWDWYEFEPAQPAAATA